MEKTQTFKVGQILHVSSSYNMTHHYFFKVLKVTPKTAVVRMLKKVATGGENFTPLVTPKEDEFAQLTEFRIRKNKFDTWVGRDAGGLEFRRFQVWDGQARRENHLD